MWILRILFFLWLLDLLLPSGRVPQISQYDMIRGGKRRERERKKLEEEALRRQQAADAETRLKSLNMTQIKDQLKQLKLTRMAPLTFNEWYDQKFNGRPTVIRAAMWVALGFIWIPLVYSDSKAVILKHNAAVDARCKRLQNRLTQLEVLRGRVFDELTGDQKLVVLDMVEALRNPEIPTNSRSERRKPV